MDNRISLTEGDLCEQLAKAHGFINPVQGYWARMSLAKPSKAFNSWWYDTYAEVYNSDMDSDELEVYLLSRAYAWVGWLAAKQNSKENK